MKKILFVVVVVFVHTPMHAQKDLAELLKKHYGGILNLASQRDRTVEIIAETNNAVTYDTTITEAANGEGPFTWNVRITRQINDTTSRPGIFFIPGSGEVGTNNLLLRNYGPHYWLLNGWDGGVLLGNGIHYPVLVSIQQPAQNMRPWHLKAVLETLLKILPVKRNSVHVTGLSQGSYEWGELIGFAAFKGDQAAMSEVKSWTDLEGVGPGDNFLGFDPPFPQAYQTWVSKYGGRFLGLEGVQDSRSIWQLTQPMNSAAPNSAYFAYENIGGGGHCCWNSMYDPKVTNWIAGQNSNVIASTNPATTYGSYYYSATTGSNLFQWMLRQGDTSFATNAPPPPAPVAVITTDTSGFGYPISVIRLSAASSTGTGLTYSWSQLSGPNTAGSSSIPGNTTDILFWGLVPGSYVFQLTVKDNLGRTSSATMPVNLLQPTPRTAASVTITVNGTSYPVPLSWLKIIYSDGNP